MTLYNGRFWAAPISIFIATYAIPAYKREKIVHGLEIGVASLGHICFLVYHGKLKKREIPQFKKKCEIPIIKNSLKSHYLKQCKMPN